jgi:hypothetical protein
MPPEETKHIPVNVYIALAISIAIIGCIGTMFSGAGQSFILLMWSKNTPEPTQTINEATIQAAVNATLTAQSTGSSRPNPTNTQTPTPTLLPTTPTPFSYCYGKCWKYDDNAHTMTWTGPTDGKEDVWQPSGKEIDSIRAGYTAIFGPMNVPGEIEACTLILDGKEVKNSCDGIMYPVSSGMTFRVQSEGNNGGFRWKPLQGYGYRK